MKQQLFVLLLISLLFAATQAQTKIPSSAPANLNQPTPLPADMAAFFNGEWTGSGKFASGRDIAADEEFKPVLDNQWLMYSHQDRSPNKYKSLAMWGFERSTQRFVMIVQDNFGGTRRFESDGWKDGKIVFLNNVSTPTLSYAERFTFEKIDERSFKMSYETNRDGKEWRLGDYVVFTRKT